MDLSNYYNNARLDKTLSYEQLTNPRRKYFWDGNNGDKHEIIKRYGYPVRILIVRNISQDLTEQAIHLEMKEYSYSLNK